MPIVPIRGGTPSIVICGVGVVRRIVSITMVMIGGGVGIMVIVLIIMVVRGGVPIVIGGGVTVCMVIVSISDSLLILIILVTMLVLRKPVSILFNVGTVAPMSSLASIVLCGRGSFPAFSF